MARAQRVYTAQDKRDVLELSEEVGAREAARRMSIPSGTVSCWRHLAKRARAAGKEWPSGPEPKSGAEGDEDEAEQEAGSTQTAKKARTARVYTPSQRAEALELAAKVGLTAASRQLGMSRWSIRQWRSKVKLAAEGKGDSPTSGPDPAEVERKRDREILSTWREHPGLGPSQIRNQLRRRGIKTSTHTVRRVMEEAGYRPPKVRRHEHDKRFESVRRNHIWHLDFLHRWIGRASTFSLIVLDDYSRFVVGHGVDDAERADLVIETFEAAVARHGKPEMVLHDKGSAFWSWKGIGRFTRLLEELGVDQIAAPFKEWNGKLEVFNANLAKELFDAHRFYDVGEMKRRLSSHLDWYNHRRTHHSLGGLLVPADRFYGREDEVMARIEAGVAADSSDALSLRDRILELFKVTSTGGQAEVWLMGQKILG
jgi:putative transposase